MLRDCVCTLPLPPQFLAGYKARVLMCALGLLVVHLCPPIPPGESSSPGAPSFWSPEDRSWSLQILEETKVAPSGPKGPLRGSGGAPLPSDPARGIQLSGRVLNGIAERPAFGLFAK